MTADPTGPSSDDRISDFQYGEKRIIAFAAERDVPAIGWPDRAVHYAATNGIKLSDAKWYEVRPQRFANGRPHVSEYQVDQQSWKYETNMKLAREIVRSLGYDPDDLPLDL